MTKEEYLKRPIYRKNRRIVELAEKLNPYRKFDGSPVMRIADSPAFRQMEKVATIYEAFESKFESYHNFLEENHLLVKEKQVKPLVNEYRKLIENEYGINVQFDKYFYESFGEMPIDEFLELIEDQGLLRHLINYAEEENQKFNRLAKTIGKAEKLPKKEEPKTYEELFDTPEKLAFVEKMLFDEGLTTLYNGKQGTYKIAPLCDALQFKKIIPKHSDEVLHGLFAQRLGLKPRRYKRDQESFDFVYKQYIRYIEAKNRTKQHRKAPK